jgi:hypothetical protein
MWSRPDDLLITAPPGASGFYTYTSNSGMNGALTAFLNLSGASSASNTAVRELRVQTFPLPSSTRCGGHWDEACFDTELMTPILNSGVNALSLVTVASLADIGYTVNLAATEISFDANQIASQCKCPKESSAQVTEFTQTPEYAVRAEAAMMGAREYGLASLQSMKEADPDLEVGLAVLYELDGQIKDVLVAMRDLDDDRGGGGGGDDNENNQDRL